MRGLRRVPLALTIRTTAIVCLPLGLIGATACSGSNPLAPIAGTETFTSSLKATAPVPLSPINDQVASNGTLSATAARPEYGAIPLQYRFQVFTATGSQALDSGPVNGPVWKMLGLTPNQRFTWKVRAEFEGTAGPWSASASFQSGDPAPSFPGPIGDWEHCGAFIKDIDLSHCVHDAVKPTNSVGDLEVVKRIAWLKRGDGAGLLIKTGGDNVVLWQGYSLSASRICFSDGRIFKVISDAGPGGANAADYSDNGTVDIGSYVPAIDPSKP
jgi:hypothetical protein